MMYKMVAFDLDGTLLNDDKLIEDRFFESIRKISKACEFVIATGRRYYSAKGFIGGILPEAKVIANNGALIKSLEDDKSIFSSSMAYKDLKGVIDMIYDSDLEALFAINHADYDVAVVRDTYEISAMDSAYYGDRIKLVDSFDGLSSYDLISAIVHGSKKDLEKFKDDLKKAYPGLYNIYLMHLSGSDKYILEVHDYQCSKWKSLVIYAASLGIRPEEIICIGDSENDMEMLENAGLGIAMSNARTYIKEKADRTSSYDNNRGGAVFEAIKALGIDYEEGLWD